MAALNDENQTVEVESSVGTHQNSEGKIIKFSSFITDCALYTTQNITHKIFSWIFTCPVSSGRKGADLGGGLRGRLGPGLGIAKPSWAPLMFTSEYR